MQNNGNDSLDEHLTMLMDMLRERAMREVGEIVKAAERRFTDIVKCWNALEAENVEMSTTEAFAHITRVITDKLDIDTDAEGAMTALTTMVMGAKLYSDATRTKETESNEV